MFYLTLIFLYYLAPLSLALVMNESRKERSSSKLIAEDFFKAALYLANFFDSDIKKYDT